MHPEKFTTVEKLRKKFDFYLAFLFGSSQYTVIQKDCKFWQRWGPFNFSVGIFGLTGFHRTDLTETLFKMKFLKMEERKLSSKVKTRKQHGSINSNRRFIFVPSNKSG